MYLLLLNNYKSNNIYKKQKFKCNRSTASKPMDTNYGKQKKENQKKILKKKHILLYVLITISQHGIEKGKFYPIFRDNRGQVKLV